MLPGLLTRLVSLARYRREIDCVWLQYVCLPDLLYAVAGKLLGFRVMVTPHLGSNWRSQSNPLLRALSATLLSMADRLALISPTQELEIRLPRRVPRSHIHNFLPEDALNEHVPQGDGKQEELHLIHAARLSEGKGTFLYLEVCRELRDAGVRFRATLAGRADEEVSARIRETIGAYALNNNVEWLGHVPENYLIALLTESDVLIHLSSIDSYPLVVLESIACATFPICIDLAGASDMVARYTGHIVQRKHAVSQTVAFLKQRQISQIRMLSREAALRVRGDYAWENCTADVLSAIRDTLRSSETART